MSWQGTPSPSSAGAFTDPDGVAWTCRHRALELKRVRRLISSADEVFLGSGNGWPITRIAPGERTGLCSVVRRAYAGPGGTAASATGEINYDADEFYDAAGRKALYVEENC